MKNFFVCCAAAIAFIACASSCDKDNSNQQPGDVRTEIARIVKGAICAVYSTESENGGRVAPYVLASAIIVERSVGSDLNGDNLDAIRRTVGAIIIFSVPQIKIPTALYILDNDDEPVMIENLNMINPTLAMGGIRVRGVATENVAGPLVLEDGVESGSAPADEYLVNLAKFNDQAGEQESRAAVLPHKLVEQNLEEHVDQYFMRVVQSGDRVVVKGVEQVQKLMAGGSGGPKFALNPLLDGGAMGAFMEVAY